MIKEPSISDVEAIVKKIAKWPDSLLEITLAKLNAENSRRDIEKQKRLDLLGKLPDISIKDLELGNSKMRIYNAFVSMGIAKNIDEVASLTLLDLLKPEFSFFALAQQPNVGRKSIIDLEYELMRHGVNFAELNLINEVK